MSGKKNWQAGQAFYFLHCAYWGHSPQSPRMQSKRCGCEVKRAEEASAMNIDLYRMRYLMKRLPMAAFNVEKAMSRATKSTRAISATPGGGGKGGSQVEDAAMHYMQAKEALETIQQELEQHRRALAPALQSLEDALGRQVMRMRYMEGRSVREIAYCLSYSEQHVFRVLKRQEAITQKLTKKES